MNKGDAFLFDLDFTVNGIPLAEGEWDEIEFSLGKKSYYLSEGDIFMNGGVYSVFISQEDSFAFSFTNYYQIRAKKGDNVYSTKVSRLKVGRVLSNTVLGEANENLSKYNAIIDRTITSIKSDASIIGDYAFRGCNALESAEFTEAVAVGFDAFYGCESLTDVILNKATTIAMEAFASSGIKTLTAPELVNIDSMGVYMAMSLEKITAPKLQTIAQTALASCASLEDVSFPNLTSIGANAFNGCRAMKSADLGKISSIANNAFVDTVALEEIVLRKNDGIVTLPSSNNPFNVSNLYVNGGSIFVPSSLIASYESNLRWANLLSNQPNLHFVAIEGSKYD